MILCSSVINYAYMDPKQREFHGLCLETTHIFDKCYQSYRFSVCLGTIYLVETEIFLKVL